MNMEATQEQRDHITTEVKNLHEKGYAVFDLIKLGYFTLQELMDMQAICMNYYYKYFTDRGLTLEDIKLDLTKNYKKNPYFKQPKDSKMFKAMYGAKTKDGRDYINCRNPANAINCGMGTATSQKEVYYDLALNEYTERLREFYKALYRCPVKRHLARFGLKIAPSKIKGYDDTY